MNGRINKLPAMTFRKRDHISAVPDKIKTMKKLIFALLAVIAYYFSHGEPANIFGILIAPVLIMALILWLPYLLFILIRKEKNNALFIQDVTILKLNTFYGKRGDLFAILCIICLCSIVLLGKKL